MERQNSKEAIIINLIRNTFWIFCIHLLYIYIYIYICRSQWPRGLRRRSSAARLLRLWVRIPPGAWMFFCCECCVLSGRGLWDRLITRPEESYRLWCVVVCDQETSKTRRLKPATGLWKIQPQWVVTPGKQTNIYIYIYEVSPVFYALNRPTGLFPQG